MGGGVVAALAVAVLVAVSLLYSLLHSPVYVARALLWQDSDVGDIHRFPLRPFMAAPEPFRFAEPLNPAASAAAVESAAERTRAVGADLESFLAATGTQAFIVIAHDTILYESYLGDFGRDSVATSFSTAKSFVSALFGIAIAEGIIDGADQPITDFLPELVDRDPTFARLSIRHLLDMTSGIAYREMGFLTGDDALTYYHPDLRRLALHHTSITEPPGERWQYNNYNPLLLGLILERASTMPVSEYLESRLWQPLGMEFGGSWSLDSDDGFEKMESGINARPIDFAKLGRLYLYRGEWNGQRILGEDWVEASTTPRTHDRPNYYPGEMEQPFGSVRHQLMWWLISEPAGRNSYAAVGKHGQFIFVSPDHELIIVRSGERSGIQAMEWLGFFTQLAAELEHRSGLE